MLESIKIDQTYSLNKVKSFDIRYLELKTKKKNNIESSNFEVLNQDISQIKDSNIRDIMKLQVKVQKVNLEIELVSKMASEVIQNLKRFYHAS